jgi:histidinol dehydrogenase
MIIIKSQREIDIMKEAGRITALVLEKLEDIISPGNIYVTMAKKLIYGYCDIDMLAGPSEIAIVADGSAEPAFVAADLLSQAEHDILSSAILLTTSRSLAEKVGKAVESQYLQLERKTMMEKSLSKYGAIIIVEDMGEAIEIVNRIAPQQFKLPAGYRVVSALADTARIAGIPVQCSM